jgi:hypothetical protein
VVAIVPSRRLFYVAHWKWVIVGRQSRFESAIAGRHLAAASLPPNLMLALTFKLGDSAIVVASDAIKEQRKELRHDVHGM